MKKISIIGISVLVAAVVLILMATIQAYIGTNIIPINALVSILAFVFTYNFLVKKYYNTGQNEIIESSIIKIKKDKVDNNAWNKFGIVILYILLIIVSLLTIAGIFKIFNLL